MSGERKTIAMAAAGTFFSPFHAIDRPVHKEEKDQEDHHHTAQASAVIESPDKGVEMEGVVEAGRWSERIIKLPESSNFFNSFLIFAGIAIAAIIGVFIRIGFGYYKIWKTDTNYVLPPLPSSLPSSLLAPSPLIHHDISSTDGLSSFLCRH